MLRELCAANPLARKTVDQCNEVLAELEQPSFEEIAWNERSPLGEDVWYTQAAMLVADYVSYTLLCAHGFRPDMVTGHSYGELPAMLAAGCWDFRSALVATWHRCRSIIEHAPAACGMLSIQATAATVERLIRDSRIPVSISHLNAREQTVVGGKQSAVAQFAQIVDNEGIASRLLAVPTAFHTLALAAAQQPFANALAQVPIAPHRARRC